jgi:hypothetical protein
VVRRVTAACIFGIASVAVEVTACSAVEPKEGPPQAAVCAAYETQTPTLSQASQSSGTYGGSAGSNGSAWNSCGFQMAACDICESANCCSVRLDCYNDPTCSAADSDLDACLDTAADTGADASDTDAASADVAAATLACWQTYLMAGGALAATRTVCESTCCRNACAIPPSIQ